MVPIWPYEHIWAMGMLTSYQEDQAYELLRYTRLRNGCTFLPGHYEVEDTWAVEIAQSGKACFVSMRDPQFGFPKPT